MCCRLRRFEYISVKCMLCFLCLYFIRLWNKISKLYASHGNVLSKNQNNQANLNLSEVYMNSFQKKIHLFCKCMNWWKRFQCFNLLYKTMIYEVNIKWNVGHDNYATLLFTQYYQNILGFKYQNINGNIYSILLLNTVSLLIKIEIFILPNFSSETKNTKFSNLS